MKFKIVTPAADPEPEEKPIEVWLGIGISGDLAIRYADRDGVWLTLATINNDGITLWSISNDQYNPFPASMLDKENRLKVARP